MKFAPIIISVFALLACLSGGCKSSETDTATQAIFLDQSLKDTHIGRFYFLRDVGLDSIEHDKQQINFPEHGRIICEIFTKDVVLGRDDSVRIGIIHPLEKVYGYPEAIALPDQLILSPYGQDTIPISLDQENVGPVTNSTVFRINRNYYGLNSLDSTRQNIVIKKLQRRPRSRPNAEMDTRLKKVSVRPLATEATDEVRLGYAEGKMTLIYFWSLGLKEGAALLELSEKVAAMGEEAPEVIAVSRADSKANLLAFCEQHPDLSFPIYQGTASTCSGLHCHAAVPYAVIVNPEGRIMTYYRHHDDLMRMLR